MLLFQKVLLIVKLNIGQLTLLKDLEIQMFFSIAGNPAIDLLAWENKLLPMFIRLYYTQ